MDGRAETDSAWLGQGFEPSRYIDPVAEDVAVVDDHVTEIDPDTELDPLALRRRRVALGHAALDFDRAAHRVNDTLKFSEQPVTGRFHDAPAVLGDAGIEEGTAMRFEIA